MPVYPRHKWPGRAAYNRTMGQKAVKRHGGRVLRWLIAVSLLALALALIAAALGPRSLLAAGRTALLLPDLLVFQPFRPSTSLTLPPSRSSLTIPGPDDGETGDLYQPAFASGSPAVIVVLGVYPAPLDDPYVRRLGDALARAGLVAYLPDSPRLREGHIEPKEIDALVAAFQAVRQLPSVDSRRVGFLGLSVGGGLALLAAADPRIADDVFYVQSVGGYSNAFDLLRAIGSHTTTGPNPQPWEPSPLAVSAYRRQLIDIVPDPDDRQRLEASYLSADPAPLNSGLLSATALQVRDLLNGGTPEMIGGLLDSLPPAAADKLRQLSPDHRLDRLRAPVLLIHDRHDPYVPVTESRQLAERLGPRALFREYDLFAHVIPSGPANVPLFLGELAALASQTDTWFRLLSEPGATGWATVR